MKVFSLSPRRIVERIVSGGQTGADRAALDAAIALGIPHGGWAPLGREAEDGCLPSRYQLLEAPTAEPALRTELNVRDSDATLILAHGTLRGGSALTRRLARQYGKPCLAINLERDSGDAALEQIVRWLAEHQPRVLNVAGPRASGDPRIYGAVHGLLLRLFDADPGSEPAAAAC